MTTRNPPPGDWPRIDLRELDRAAEEYVRRDAARRATRRRGGLISAAESIAGFLPAARPAYFPDPYRLQWGHWRLDPREHTLRHTIHPSCELDLDRMNTCGEMLDWIFHICAKRWATADDRANLIEALRTIFDAQVQLCPGGDAREIRARAFLTLKYADWGQK